MEKINDDWPAVRGMTLRDWFAGMAMQAIIGRVVLSDPGVFSGVAEKSYEFADAIIYQRVVHEKEPGDV